MLSDWDIEALIDNELGADERAKVWSLMKADAPAQRRYNELKRQKYLLIQWFQRHNIGQ